MRLVFSYLAEVDWHNILIWIGCGANLFSLVICAKMGRILWTSSKRNGDSYPRRAAANIAPLLGGLGASLFTLALDNLIVSEPLWSAATLGLLAIACWVIASMFAYWVAGRLGDIARLNNQLTSEMQARDKINDRLRLVIESSPCGILMVNPAGKIILSNGQVESLFGYQHAELAGRPIEILVPERFRTGHGSNGMDRVMPSGDFDTHHDLEIIGLRKDGSEFPMEWRLNTLLTDQEVRLLVSIVDISERKATQLALAKYANELKQSNAVLSQFAYVASHDLREPLRKVVSFCQRLQEKYQGRLDEEADRLICYAVEGSNRMQAMTSDLLRLCQVASGDVPITPVDANAACDRAIDNLQTRIREAEGVVQHDHLPVLMAEETHLVLLFQNLIGNAIKFRAGNPPQVFISSKESDAEHIISVADNGIGIDAKYHERVFRIFQRLHGREEYPGTGIGLAICERIVQRLGGRIWFESACGQGTTFYFTVPLARRDDANSRASRRARSDERELATVSV